MLHIKQIPNNSLSIKITLFHVAKACIFIYFAIISSLAFAGNQESSFSVIYSGNTHGELASCS